MTVRLMVVKNRTRPRSDLRSSIELEHDLGCYRHLLTLYFSIVSSVFASDQTLKIRFFGLTPLVKRARARTPARSCPFACVPRTVVPPPVHVDVRMRMDHHHAPWFREFHNIRLLTACDRVPGFGSKGFGVWVTGPVIPVNLLCVSPTRLPGDVARWLRGMWLRGMNEFALKCEESDL